MKKQVNNQEELYASISTSVDSISTQEKIINTIFK